MSDMIVHMTDDVAADLGRAVEISKRMQEISAESFLMQLQATNAIVMTRSRGINVPGFEAVSEQMGQVSRELGQQLAALRECTTTWVNAVSTQVGLSREVSMLTAARDVAPHMRERVEEVVAPLRERLFERADTERHRRSFVLALDDVRRTAATGCVLARTAKIEAAYGDVLADVLAETASTFTQLADSVDESVRTIARWIGASGGAR